MSGRYSLDKGHITVSSATFRWLSELVADAEACSRSTINTIGLPAGAEWADTTLKRLLEIRSAVTALQLLMYVEPDDECDHA